MSYEYVEDKDTGSWVDRAATDIYGALGYEQEGYRPPEYEQHYSYADAQEEYAYTQAISREEAQAVERIVEEERAGGIRRFFSRITRQEQAYKRERGYMGKFEPEQKYQTYAIYTAKIYRHGYIF